MTPAASASTPLPPAAAPARRGRRVLSRAALILAPWLLILLAWYGIRASGLISPALVPAPHAVAAKFIELMQGRLGQDVLMSTQRVFLGVVLGVAGGNVAAHFLKVSPVVPLDWVAIGLFICSLVGIVFGTYPAFKAANLDPIESLRYE